MSEENESEKEKSKYFSLSEAADDIGNSYGVAETTGATLKLLGKTVLNLGIFAVTDLPKAMIETAERQKNKND
ncbi:MAG: hypothetical protein ACOY9J_13170 [Pseudomonadota bacterium]